MVKRDLKKTSNKFEVLDTSNHSNKNNKLKHPFLENSSKTLQEEEEEDQIDEAEVQPLVQ